MQEKLAALKKKFDSLPPAAKVAAAAGVGLLLFMLMKLLKGSSTKTTAANQYTESDGTIIYPYAVDYTEAAGGGNSSGGSGAADGYYATTADLAALVDAMTAGNTMLLDRIDSTMRGSDVTNGNIMPQTHADITQAGILDNTPVLASVVPGTSGSKVAADGKIYATGGTGKQYVYNPASGNIMVNGKTVATGSADYNATYKAMLNDGVSIPGASAATNGSSSGSSTSGSKKTGSGGSSSSSKKTTATSTKTTGTGNKTASDGKVYATGGSGKSYVYNPKTGNVMVNGKTVTKGSSTYNKTIAAAKADGVKI